MSAVLAVDPGIRGCGVAVFVDGALKDAAYVRSPCLSGNSAAECSSMANAVWSWALAFRSRAWEAAPELVVEWPRVYATAIRRGQSPGDPNDLLALAGVDAALAALFGFARATTYRPSEWKGQLPKEACHARMMRSLRPEEAPVVTAVQDAAGSFAHNALDAIGIGLHHLGRLRGARVYPR